MLGRFRNQIQRRIGRGGTPIFAASTHVASALEAHRPQPVRGFLPTRAESLRSVRNPKGIYAQPRQGAPKKPRKTDVFQAPERPNALGPEVAIPPASAHSHRRIHMLKKALFAAALALGFTLSFGGSSTSDVKGTTMSVQAVGPAYADCPWWDEDWCK